jgi:hypothetical protein
MINHIMAMLLFAAIIAVIVGIGLLAFYAPVAIGIVLGIIAAVSLYLFCLEIVRK